MRVNISPAFQPHDIKLHAVPDWRHAKWQLPYQPSLQMPVAPKNDGYNYHYLSPIVQRFCLITVQPQCQYKIELRTQRGVYWMYYAQTHEQPMGDEPIAGQAEAQLEQFYPQEHPLPFVPAT